MLEGGGKLVFDSDKTRTDGFLPESGEPSMNAVVTTIPDDVTGAEKSVCGLKRFLVYERRVFNSGPEEKHVDCSKVAVLDIVDSPVHVHGQTVETYHVISGSGVMVLGEETIPVSANNYILIPPGVPHGMKSADGKAVRVLMTFSPGLAPLSSQEYRDEKIIAPDVDTYLKPKVPQEE